MHTLDRHHDDLHRWGPARVGERVAVPLGTLATRPTWADPSRTPSRAERSRTHKLESRIGRVLDGRYELESLLSAGGMGAVYRGRDRAWHGAVAVKILHSDLSTVSSSARRFEREATSVRRLDHPHCVRVLDSGATPDGVKYLVMELLEGEELRARIGPDHLWAGDAACELLAQLLAGLAHAHAHAVVHRDIKPENVFMTTDPEGCTVAKLLDFGIAKLLDAAGVDVLTQTGVVLGTPRYMSPEQAAGGKADARSDLYAIGIIAHELLSGTPPFVDEDPGVLLRAQIVTPPPPLPAAVPAALHVWVAAMLEKSRNARPSSASEARRQLLELRAELWPRH